ncbi:MAG: PAS domain S-box protein [Rhodospirillaceae bacterium]
MIDSAAIDHTTVALILDGEGRIVHASAPAERLFGYPPADIRSLELWHLLIVPGTDLRRTGGTVDWLQHMSTSSRRHDVRAIAQSGRWFPYHALCESFVFHGQTAYTLSLASKHGFDDGERLSTSETFLKRIIETAGDAIVSVDGAGRITLFNPMAEKVFGYRSDEVLGRPLEMLLPEHIRPQHGKLMNEFAHGPATTRMMGQRSEISGVRKDGGRFVAEASISHFKSDDGSVFTAVLRDVTEFRRIDRERHKSARIAQAILNQTFQFLAILKTDGTVLELNDAALRFGDLQRENAVGNAFSSFPSWCPTEDSRQTMDSAIRRAASGETVRPEFFVRNTGHRDRIFSATIKPVYGATDTVSVLIFEASDITEHVRAAEELTLSEERLFNAQRIARVGNWDWDIGSGNLYWSDEIYRIFGHSRTKFAATYDGFLDCIHPDDRERVARAVGECLETGNPYSLDHRILRPSGEIRVVHEQGEIVFDAAGAPVQMTGIVQDITEQKEIENNLRAAKVEAEAASHAKSAFLANMSHELRTPLNAILGFSEVIVNELYGPLQPEKYRAYTRQIFDSGQHLLGLINNILDMSKIEAGRMMLSETGVDLPALLDACASLFAQRAEERGVTLVREWDPILPPVVADELLLKQVVLNLLSNAVKFTPEGGAIRLASSRTIDGVTIIRVTDTGIGMEESEIPKALEVFGQIDNTLTRKYEGTGLGLPLTEALVRLHDGRLRISSQPGRGTEVTVELPAHRSMVPGASLASPAGSSLP